MLVHNLILTKDFDAKLANDPDTLKMFIPLFDDIVNDLTAIQDITIRDKFAESIVAGELRDSNSDTGEPISFEAFNSILRHFMSEKWAQKASKANKPAHPTAGKVPI